MIDSPAAAVELVRELVDQVWNQGRTELLEQFYAQEFAHGDRIDTSEGLRAWHRGELESWADAHYELLDAVSDGRTVAVPWRATARHVGPGAR